MSVSHPPSCSDVKPSILLVEDNVAVQMTLEAYLEKEGFNVIVVDDGQRALQKLREISADIRNNVNLVGIVTDQNMGGQGKDGTDFLEQVFPDSKGEATAISHEVLNRIKVVIFQSDECDPSKEGGVYDEIKTIGDRITRLGKAFAMFDKHQELKLIEYLKANI